MMMMMMLMMMVMMVVMVTYSYTAALRSDHARRCLLVGYPVSGQAAVTESIRPFAGQ